MTPYSAVVVADVSGAIYFLHITFLIVCLVYNLTVMMVEFCSSETSVNCLRCVTPKKIALFKEAEYLQLFRAF
jgi:hypothetical protein